MIQLSICIITKDACENLRRCIASIRECVTGLDAEILVTDIGSREETAQTAERMGVKVYRFEGADDLSAVKNFCMSKAAGDNVFFIDPDEYMTDFHADDREAAPYFLYRLGKACFFKEEYGSAVGYFADALDYNPSLDLDYIPDMLSAYGFSLVNAGLAEEALVLESVFDRFSEDADFLFVMGLIYENNSMIDEAVECFRLASQRPDSRVDGVNSFRAYYHIGRLFERVGRLDEAAEYYEKCAGFAPAEERVAGLCAAKPLVLFLPYKASMWDCMESIYDAFADDGDFDTFVMPIPYFAVNEETGKAEQFLDEGYPEGTRILDYQKTDLKAMHPYAIFIHNPYDGANMVTSVHPAYYSDKLKHFTDRLIYVQYYASPNGLSEGMSVLPAYRNIDYWIVPSTAFKEGARDNPFYEKMVPLGSPKYDRAVILSRERPLPPTEWGDIPKDKKIILICTTIASVLSDMVQYIENYRSLFAEAAKRDDAFFVWRPHPLAEKSFRALRSAQCHLWKELVDFFEENAIGVLDRSPDISLAVACTDAEIDDGSSIASLYMVAKKPILRMGVGDFDIAKVRRFIDDVVGEKNKEDIEQNFAAMQKWCEYADGSCGQRIHDWLKAEGSRSAGSYDG